MEEAIKALARGRVRAIADAATSYGSELADALAAQYEAGDNERMEQCKCPPVASSRQT
jgi:hypothetical protein